MDHTILITKKSLLVSALPSMHDTSVSHMGSFDSTHMGAFGQPVHSSAFGVSSAPALGCGGVPIGAHTNFGGSSIAGGFQGTGHVTYGSPTYSIDLKADGSHFGTNNASTYSGTAYYCPTATSSYSGSYTGYYAGGSAFSFGSH
jgi:hypothetical protein